MGKYHPHGDSAIYDSLVRMAQPFAMRYPLVDGQGNFGSVDGDPPATMRYTEARLSRVATALLEDIDKETVDFKPNYDDSEQEPEVLPTRVPEPAGQRVERHRRRHGDEFPPHNLTEIINATIHLIQHPTTQLAKIMEYVQGPDFPTGGFILGRQGILQAYMTGRGQLKLRARLRSRRCRKDREQIVVTEIPYQVNKSRLIEAASALVNEKKIEGIGDIRDESDRDGMRIVFELKRGEQAEVVLNNLYKHTQLQIGFGIIMLSIVNGQPRELGLIDCIKYLHRSPHRSGAPAYGVRTAQGARARAHFARLPEGAGPPGRSDPHHPRRQGAARSPRGFDRRLPVQREAGAGDHRTAVAAPHRDGAAEDPGRAGGHPTPYRGVPGTAGVRYYFAAR